MGLGDTIREWWTASAEGTSLPPENRLDFAVRDLIKFYAVDSMNVITNYTDYEDESGHIGLDAGDIAELQENAEAYQKIRSMFQDTSSGALGIEDIMSELEENCLPALGEDTLKSLVAVKFEKWANFKVNETKHSDKFGVMDQCGYLVDSPVGKDTDVEQGLNEKRIPPMGGNEEGPADGVTNPYLSGIMLNSPRLCPANARSTAGSIFFNSIPTQEMSQCAPIIGIDFVSETNYITDGSRLMSLFGFTGRNFRGNTVKDPGKNIDLETLAAERDLGSWWDSIAGDRSSGEAVNPISGQVEEFVNERRRISASGIELFQAPQTMNNASSGEGLNPTVPLATLTSLSIGVSGLGLSTLCNKTASLEFILHDRSQMRLISPLVGASTFAATYLNIEFGWSHPQASAASSDNVYANFLNSLRSRSSYNIQMAETTILEDGQVRVSLKLASRGTTELINLPAASGVTHVPAYVLQPYLGPLTEQIADNVDGYNGLQSSAQTGLEERDYAPLKALSEARLKEIQTGYSALSSMTSPAAQIPLDKYREFLEELRPTGGDGETDHTRAITRGVEIIKEIYDLESSGTDEVLTTLGRQITEKQLLLKSIDIFEDGGTVVGALDEAANSQRAQTQASVAAFTALAGAGAAGERIIAAMQKADKARALEEHNAGSDNPSLGSVMLTYFGRPLQAIGKYDEVQIIFYPLNAQSGKMAGVNLARFPLIGFSDFINKTNLENPRISCASFAEKLFRDPCGPENAGHPNYGLSDIYEIISAESLEDMESEDKAAARARFTEEKAQRLTAIYNGTYRQPIFTVPDLNIFTEVLPMRTKADVNSGLKERQCVRIHVYDAKSGIPVEAELLQSMITSGRACIAIDNPEESAEAGEKDIQKQTSIAASDASSARGRAIIDRAVTQGVVEKRDVPASGGGRAQIVFVNSSPAQAIKDSIKSIYPHIEFGSQYTNVKSVGMSSNTGGSVGQVLLLNSIEASRESFSSTAQPSGGLDDIFIVPTSATLRTAGFPNVRYAEKYYIDMGTGTTADNFYYVTGINHTITPGNFETTLTMTYNGSATNRSLRNTMTAIAEAE